MEDQDNQPDNDDALNELLEVFLVEGQMTFEDYVARLKALDIDIEESIRKIESLGINLDEF